MNTKIKNFYKAFEDKHRGTREEIKNRLKIYLQFIEPLKTLYDKPKALDIGCGRGEWLELLKENSFIEMGVDIDEYMLEACTKLNLNILCEDAIKYLQTQEDESIEVISAFHVIEHISFEDLHILVSESLRVLKPAGLLILETPNAQNIKVATENFYMDPTHTKPIPSELLSFLLQYHGFDKKKTLGLQESMKLEDFNNITIKNILESVSPDYAIIAQKKAKEDFLFIFNKPFSLNLGISLDELVLKFEERLIDLENKFDKAIYQANTQVRQVNIQLQEANIQVQEGNTRVQQLNTKYELLINSHSWKITKPLRVLVKYAKSLSFISPRELLNKSIKYSIYKINSKPKLKIFILKIINNFPKTKAKLKKIVTSSSFKQKIQDQKLQQLSPEAKIIYNKLKETF